MRLIIGVGLGLSLMVNVSAQADDFNRDAVRGETYCFPTQFAIETVGKLKGADADKKDVVAPPLTPRFRIFDGGVMPTRYFIKGEQEIDFTIAPSGATPDFMTKVERAEKDSEICITDPTRIGRPGDDEGLYFEMGLTPEFKNTSGIYKMEELKEGTDDGKSLYKKMIPAVARMFMPSTDHLSLRYEAEGTPFQAVAYKDGKALPSIKSEIYNEAYVFDLDDLEDMGADTLKISGGPYTLSPVPSIKTMKKYDIGEKKIYTQNENGDWVR
jgi:hypothetical protein